ncbi:MAG: hypothetical protein ACTSQJ_07730 [Promethearchaeota archaeon]
MAETPFYLVIIRWFIESIQFVVAFTLLVFTFGTLLYLFAYIYRLKDRSELYEKNFWFRSILVTFSSFIVVFLFGLIFLLLLFSGIIEEIPSDLIIAIITINIVNVVTILLESEVVLFFIAIGAVILSVIVISLFMLEAYQVKLVWTTVTFWSAVGAFLLIDLSFGSFIFGRGIVAVYNILGELLQESIMNLAFPNG